MSKNLCKILLFQALFTPYFLGCAYKWGLYDRAIPGGYKQIAVPLFKNESPEVGIEAPFSDALIRRFSRSQVARVIGRSEAPVVLLGTIRKVQILGRSQISGGEGTFLPSRAVLTTEYQVVVSVEIKIMKSSDEKVIWQGNFQSERVYQAPRIGKQVLNSANAIYNQSVKIETIARLAEEMMAEAHDRITENF